MSDDRRLGRLAVLDRFVLDVMRFVPSKFYLLVNLHSAKVTMEYDLFSIFLPVYLVGNTCIPTMIAGARHESTRVIMRGPILTDLSHRRFLLVVPSWI